jgi:NADH:ubiquinone oxidoreductase subunit C
MNDFEKIPSELGLTETWEEKNGSRWLSLPCENVRSMTSLMLSQGARFITIAGMELPDEGGLRLDYHWDLDGELLTFVVTQDGKEISSIYDLCPAADWIEREIHEYLALDFVGRDCEPLLLRVGEPVGVHLHKEDE